MIKMSDNVDKISSCTENCAEMVMYSLRNAYNDTIGTISCTKTLKAMRESENYSEIKDFNKAGRNDIIFFDWYKGAYGLDNAEHVGVVESVDGNLITYVDYNSAQNPRHFERHTMSVSNPYIRAIMHRKADSKVNYTPVSILLKKGNSGALVGLLQVLLNRYNKNKIDVDGLFGNETESALKVFQTTMCIEVDGIAGEETFTTFYSILKQ